MDILFVILLFPLSLIDLYCYLSLITELLSSIVSLCINALSFNAPTVLFAFLHTLFSASA